MKIFSFIEHDDVTILTLLMSYALITSLMNLDTHTNTSSSTSFLITQYLGLKPNLYI